MQPQDVLLDFIFQHGGKWYGVDRIGNEYPLPFAIEREKGDDVIAADLDFCKLTNGDVAALVDLYNSMLLMGESGIGYSPKTAEAFKKLHSNHPVGIQLPPAEPTALELGAAVRRLGLA